MKIKLKIEDISSEGLGIGRFEDRVIFVENALPTEIVEVEITDVKKKFSFARVVSYIDTAHFRVEPVCPHYKECGGCDFMHIRYEKALEFKKKILLNNFKKFGNIEFDTEKIKTIAANNQLYYRNKVIQPVRKGKDGKLECGFFQKGTHNIISIPNCKIEDTRAKEIINFIIEEAKKENIEPYDEIKNKGYLRAIGYRIEKRTGKIMLFFVTTENNSKPLENIIRKIDFKFSNINSIYMNVNSKRGNNLLGDTNVLLSGKKYLDLYLGKAIYRVKPDTFFQINSEQAEKMFNEIISFLPFERMGVVWDLYAGVGAVSFFLASEFRKIYMIEKVHNSIEMAKENKKINFATNVEIIEGDLEKKDIASLEKPDVVVIDPPRKGVSPLLRETLIKILPKKIVMISCNSATLARDLSLLKDYYKIEKITMVDMFPQTHHIETVVLLERSK